MGAGDPSNDGRMQQRDQELMMTGERDSRGPRPLEHVKKASVLLIEVEVRGGQPVERSGEVPRDRDRLQEDLGHDHGTADVQPDSSRHSRDERAERAEVGEGRLPERGPIECRTHVDDIGTDGDVDSQWHVPRVGRRQVAMNRVPGRHVRGRPRPRRRPARRFDVRRPAHYARAKRSEVSRAKPKEPAMSRVPTSSLVLPAIASSRS